MKARKVHIAGIKQHVLLWLDGHYLSLHNMSSLYFMSAWVFWFLVNRLFLIWERGEPGQQLPFPAFPGLHWPGPAPAIVGLSGSATAPGSQVSKATSHVPGHRGPSVCLWVILETQVGHRSADHLHDNGTVVGSELIGIHQRIAVSRCCHKPAPEIFNLLWRAIIKCTGSDWLASDIFQIPQSIFFINSFSSSHHGWRWWK